MNAAEGSELAQVLNIIIWPAVLLISVLMLRGSITKILNRFSSADELKLSVGSLTVQAKAMREIHESIDLGFKNTTLRKSEVEALIDTKIRSIQAAIDYELTGTEIRNDPRTIESRKIVITNENGDTFDGETLDVSDAGIGFKSAGRLEFQEVVQIGLAADESTESPSAASQLKIVRIEQSKEGFYYGAAVPVVA